MTVSQKPSESLLPKLLLRPKDGVPRRFLIVQRLLFVIGIAFTLIAAACGGSPPPPGQVILYTDASTPQELLGSTGFTTNGVSWARNVCQNNTYPMGLTPQWEWTPVVHPTQEYDNPVVGISGTAVNPRTSGGNPGGDVTEDYSGNANRFNSQADVPFDHPFGTDFDFWVAPDQHYNTLLAPSATNPNPTNDPDYKAGLDQAKQDGLQPLGLLGVETDRRLIPPEYRPYEKDRVVVFGRWIADCGHDDFLTEIHPPLLQASAHASGEATNVKVISRPYLVSQDYCVGCTNGQGGQDDGAFVAHADHEIRKVKGLENCFPTPFGFPCSARLEAHPKIYTTPFAGVQIMSFYVTPPTARQSPNQKLLVSGHFTIRSGVTVTVISNGKDQLQVIVIMNDNNYKPAQLPKRYDRIMHVGDLSLSDRTEFLGIWQLYPDGALGPAYSNGILAKGFLTDSYDPPLAQSPLDTQNVVTNMFINDVNGATMFSSVDDNQPFPIYGSLTLQWKPTTVKITSPADQSSFGQSSTGSGHTNPITFTASATDPLDNPLTGTALQWTVDGSPLGTGETFSAMLKADTCVITPHKVTVTATDNAGHKASDTITVFTGNIC